MTNVNKHYPNQPKPASHYPSPQTYMFRPIDPEEYQNFVEYNRWKEFYEMHKYGNDFYFQSENLPGKTAKRCLHEDLIERRRKMLKTQRTPRCNDRNYVILNKNVIESESTSRNDSIEVFSRSGNNSFHKPLILRKSSGQQNLSAQSNSLLRNATNSPQTIDSPHERYIKNSASEIRNCIQFLRSAKKYPGKCDNKVNCTVPLKPSTSSLLSRKREYCTDTIWHDEANDFQVLRLQAVQPNSTRNYNNPSACGEYTQKKCSDVIPNKSFFMTSDCSEIIEVSDESDTEASISMKGVGNCVDVSEKKLNIRIPLTEYSLEKNSQQSAAPKASGKNLIIRTPCTEYSLENNSRQSAAPKASGKNVIIRTPCTEYSLENNSQQSDTPKASGKNLIIRTPCTEHSLENNSQQSAAPKASEKNLIIRTPCTEYSVEKNTQQSAASKASGKNLIIRSPCTEHSLENNTQQSAAPEASGKHLIIRTPCTEYSLENNSRQSAAPKASGKNVIIRTPCTEYSVENNSRQSAAPEASGKNVIIRTPCTEYSVENNSRQSAAPKASGKNVIIRTPCTEYSVENNTQQSGAPKASGKNLIIRTPCTENSLENSSQQSAAPKASGKNVIIRTPCTEYSVENNTQQSAFLEEQKKIEELQDNLKFIRNSSEKNESKSSELFSSSKKPKQLMQRKNIITKKLKTIDNRNNKQISNSNGKAMKRKKNSSNLYCNENKRRRKERSEDVKTCLRKGDSQDHKIRSKEFNTASKVLRQSSSAKNRTLHSKVSYDLYNDFQTKKLIQCNTTEIDSVRKHQGDLKTNDMYRKEASVQEKNCEVQFENDLLTSAGLSIKFNSDLYLNNEYSIDSLSDKTVERKTSFKNTKACSLESNVPFQRNYEPPNTRDNYKDSMEDQDIFLAEVFLKRKSNSDLNLNKKSTKPSDSMIGETSEQKESLKNPESNALFQCNYESSLLRENHNKPMDEQDIFLAQFFLKRKSSSDSHRKKVKLGMGDADIKAPIEKENEEYHPGVIGKTEQSPNPHHSMPENVSPQRPIYTSMYDNIKLRRQRQREWRQQVLEARNNKTENVIVKKRKLRKNKTSISHSDKRKLRTLPLSSSKMSQLRKKSVKLNPKFISPMRHFIRKRILKSQELKVPENAPAMDNETKNCLSVYCHSSSDTQFGGQLLKSRYQFRNKKLLCNQHYDKFMDWDRRKIAKPTRINYPLITGTVAKSLLRYVDSSSVRMSSESDKTVEFSQICSLLEDLRVSEVVGEVDRKLTRKIIRDSIFTHCYSEVTRKDKSTADKSVTCHIDVEKTESHCLSSTINSMTEKYLPTNYSSNHSQACDIKIISDKEHTSTMSKRGHCLMEMGGSKNEVLNPPLVNLLDNKSFMTILLHQCEASQHELIKHAEDNLHNESLPILKRIESLLCSIINEMELLQNESFLYRMKKENPKCLVDYSEERGLVTCGNSSDYAFPHRSLNEPLTINLLYLSSPCFLKSNEYFEIDSQLLKCFSDNIKGRDIKFVFSTSLQGERINLMDSFIYRLTNTTLLKPFEVGSISAKLDCVISCLFQTKQSFQLGFDKVESLDSEDCVQRNNEYISFIKTGKFSERFGSYYPITNKPRRISLATSSKQVNSVECCSYGQKELRNKLITSVGEECFELKFENNKFLVSIRLFEKLSNLASRNIKHSMIIDVIPSGIMSNFLHIDQPSEQRFDILSTLDHFTEDTVHTLVPMINYKKCTLRKHGDLLILDNCLNYISEKCEIITFNYSVKDSTKCFILNYEFRYQFTNNFFIKPTAEFDSMVTLLTDFSVMSVRDRFLKDYHSLKESCIKHKNKNEVKCLSRSSCSDKKHRSSNKLTLDTGLRMLRLFERDFFNNLFINQEENISESKFSQYLPIEGASKSVISGNEERVSSLIGLKFISLCSRTLLINPDHDRKELKGKKLRTFKGRSECLNKSQVKPYLDAESLISGSHSRFPRPTWITSKSITFARIISYERPTINTHNPNGIHFEQFKETFILKSVNEVTETNKPTSENGDIMVLRDSNYLNIGTHIDSADVMNQELLDSQCMDEITHTPSSEVIDIEKLLYFKDLIDITDISEDMDIEELHVPQCMNEITDISEAMDIKELHNTQWANEITDISEDKDIKELNYPQCSIGITDISEDMDIEELHVPHCMNEITDISEAMDIKELHNTQWAHDISEDKDIKVLHYPQCSIGITDISEAMNIEEIHDPQRENEILHTDNACVLDVEGLVEGPIGWLSDKQSEMLKSSRELYSADHPLLPDTSLKYINYSLLGDNSLKALDEMINVDGEYYIHKEGNTDKNVTCTCSGETEEHTVNLSLTNNSPAKPDITPVETLSASPLSPDNQTANNSLLPILSSFIERTLSSDSQNIDFQSIIGFDQSNKFNTADKRINLGNTCERYEEINNTTELKQDNETENNSLLPIQTSNVEEDLLPDSQIIDFQSIIGFNQSDQINIIDRTINLGNTYERYADKSNTSELMQDEEAENNFPGVIKGTEVLDMKCDTTPTKLDCSSSNEKEVTEEIISIKTGSRVGTLLNGAQENWLCDNDSSKQEVRTSIFSRNSFNIEKDYPVIWEGLLLASGLSLPEHKERVKMHFVMGNNEIATKSFSICDSDRSNSLELSHKMELEKGFFDILEKFIKKKRRYCILVGVPFEESQHDGLKKTNSKIADFLSENNIGGIVHITKPDPKQASYFVHILTWCDFTRNLLAKRAPPYLLQQLEDTDAFITIIISSL